MSVEDEYTATKAKSLKDMKRLATKRYCSYTKHVGCVLQPLFDVPLKQIVFDELHLLRIGDVPFKWTAWFIGGRSTEKR